MHANAVIPITDVADETLNKFLLHTTEMKIKYLFSINT